MIDATLEPVEALKRRIAELESFLLNYDHAMKIERHDFKSEISALQTKLELARKFIDAFTKHHAEMCSTFLDDAPEDECDCAKGAATKLLARLAAPHTDHCPSCGEYLHDEMGHMCPDTGVQQDPYVRLRAALVENDHLKRQLAEARAEINGLREKLGWVPAVFDTEALREAGK